MGFFFFFWLLFRSSASTRDSMRHESRPGGGGGGSCCHLHPRPGVAGEGGPARHNTAISSELNPQPSQVSGPEPTLELRRLCRRPSLYLAQGAGTAGPLPRQRARAVLDLDHCWPCLRGSRTRWSSGVRISPAPAPPTPPVWNPRGTVSIRELWIPGNSSVQFMDWFLK